MFSSLQNSDDLTSVCRIWGIWGDRLLYRNSQRHQLKFHCTHSNTEKRRYQHLFLSLLCIVDSTSLTFLVFSALRRESFSSDDLSWEIWEPWTWVFLLYIFCCWFTRLLFFEEFVNLLSLAVSVSIEVCNTSNSTPVKWSGGNKASLC